jgi:protein-L-isoaspartate(D-aspartate) O-methyltransferase
MRPTEDNLHHQLLRQRLVMDVRRKGISDERVLGAIANIPRHFFMDEAQDKVAYVDRAFPIGEGQTISQPYTVAYQTQLLQVEPLDKVLEIGTGSAYQAAVLAEMGAKLFTIERQRKLFERNRNFAYIRQFENIQFFYGDGYEGLPDYAPFDRILLTAAAAEVPPKLIRQLKPGGKMVLPLSSGGDYQRMVRITKMDDGELMEESFDLFSFVPMLRGRKE